MKEDFDRLAEFDRVRGNGHSNDCAVGIVCRAEPCTCGCIPKWVVNSKLYKRWKYQTTTRRNRKEMSQHNRIRIVSDGTSAGTKITTPQGEELQHIKAFTVTGMAPGLLKAELLFTPPVLEVEALCLNIEELAKALHDSGREAFEKGATVAAAKFAEENRKYVEWEELPEQAREGRYMQAKALLQHYHIAARVR